jgi:glycine/D-amino acid oxidase-like deaminating enzyme
MAVPAPDAVETDDALPRKADVLVIGGGIIGVTAALFLARKGLQVTLCEKGHIAGEQSGRNWGWVRVMGRDPREIPLALDSQRLWETISENEGVELGFRRAGIIYVFDTPRMRDTYTAWAGHARDYQITTRLLDRAGLQALVPGFDPRIEGGLYAPSDARAEPQKAAPAFAALARRAGARIVTRCAVRSIEASGGKVSGVVTEHGPVEAPAVLLAGGAWSRLFCGNLGLDLPQLMIKGTVSRVEGAGDLPETSVGGSSFAYRRRLDGGFTIAQRGANISELTPDSFRLFFDYLPAWRSEWRDLRLRLGPRFREEWQRRRRWSADECSPFEDVRVLDPAPERSIVESGLRNLQNAVPAFRSARVTHSWGGMIDTTPDGVPVIGAVDGLPGFYVATGFTGHGFGIGPGAGKLVADLIAGDRPGVDAEPYRLSRFARADHSSRTLRAVSLAR